eukprot:365817-Chlamydomonas_euryale.AAC.8
MCPGGASPRGQPPKCVRLVGHLEAQMGNLLSRLAAITNRPATRQLLNVRCGTEAVTRGEASEHLTITNFVRAILVHLRKVKFDGLFAGPCLLRLQEVHGTCVHNISLKMPWQFVSGTTCPTICEYQMQSRMKKGWSVAFNTASSGSIRIRNSGALTILIPWHAPMPTLDQTATAVYVWCGAHGVSMQRPQSSAAGQA